MCENSDNLDFGEFREPFGSLDYYMTGEEFLEEMAWLHYASGIQDMREIKHRVEGWF